MVRLNVGCCGFPGGMKSYFREFKLVEVQTTFYNLPRVETAMGWRQEAPKDFRFAVKAWQGMTHPTSMPTWRGVRTPVPREKKERYGLLQPTEEVFEAWRKTREICEVLEAPICLVQCPAAFDASETNMGNMRSFFSEIHRGGLTIAWEPRGPTWNERLVEALCKELELIYCVDPFAKLIPSFQRTVYLRLHGSPPGKKLYGYRYSDEDLGRLWESIRYLREETEVYCLFNNISMMDDAKRLLAFAGL